MKRTHQPLDVILLLAALAAYAWFTVYLPWHNLHSNDFKHIYLGAKALLDGNDPYSARSLLHQASLSGMRDANLNPYVYLPFTGLSLSFLAPLQFAAAAKLWLVLNHLFALASCWLTAKAIFPQRLLRALAVLLLGLAISHPMTRTLTAGQLNLVLLLCVSGAFYLLKRRHEKTAGFVLGFAACFKLAPALFLFYFALRRRWTALVSMGATCAALMLVSLLAVGLKVHLLFLPLLHQMRYGHSSWEQYRATFWKDPANQSFNSLFTHLLVGDQAITPWFHSTQATANAATWAASLAMFGLFIWTAARRTSATNDAAPRGTFTSADEALFMATLLLSLLLPSLMWDHYLVLVLLPVAWLVRCYYAAGRPAIVIAILISYTVICMPWPFEHYRSGPVLPLMSIKLFPTMLLFVLCCRATRLANQAALLAQRPAVQQAENLLH